MIDRLPDQASWDDSLYELYVKQKIEMGLAAMTEGKTVAHEEAVRSAYYQANPTNRVNAICHFLNAHQDDCTPKGQSTKKQ